MTPMDYFAIMIAVISLFISLWSAFKANTLANNNIRLSLRTELHNLLHSVEQVVIYFSAMSPLRGRCVYSDLFQVLRNVSGMDVLTQQHNVNSSETLVGSNKYPSS